MSDLPGKEVAATNDETLAPTDRAAAAQARRELGHLEAQIAAARALLASLQRDVASAESRLGNSQAVLLVESNEQLVVSALRAQTDAVTTAIALDEMSQSHDRDPLTHLPNRLLLLDRFSHAIAGAKRNGTQLALLFLDLDGFKPINDAHGHAAGDAVLKHVAVCLSATVRGADTVSRHGGDEFLILLTDVSQPADAALTAAKVLAAIGTPFTVSDERLALTASIGISIYPDDGEEPHTLVQHADAAMYRAKKHGRGGFAFHGETPVSGQPGL